MPGETFSNSRKESSPWAVCSESVNEPGDRPPPAVNENCCGASGCASTVTLIAPSLSFTNVQMMFSLTPTSMFVGEEPSSQVIEVRSHPGGSVVCNTEYPVPGGTMNWRGASVASLSEKFTGLCPGALNA